MQIASVAWTRTTKTAARGMPAVTLLRTQLDNLPQLYQFSSL